jgi:hypothetical protein
LKEVYKTNGETIKLDKNKNMKDKIIHVTIIVKTIE